MSGKKNGKKSSIKRKGLFDHINQIKKTQNPKYWDNLSEEDKKTWSNYMIHRFLSMNMNLVDIVNELQKYNLKPKDLYKLYTNILPKDNRFYKYVKGRNEMQHPQWLINLIATHMKSSKKEAYDAVEMYMLTEGGMLELGEICRKYGVEPKKIEKAGLNVLGSVGMYQAGNSK